MTSKHNGQALAEYAGAIPADERMTPAELRVVLGWLGLSQRDAAALCGVEERSVRRWLAGDRAIPDGVRVRIEQIEDHTAEQVGRYAETLQDAAGQPGIVTHRTDAELWGQIRGCIRCRRRGIGRCARGSRTRSSGCRSLMRMMPAADDY